jgi:lipopolysaccharide export system protein LptC
LTAWLLKWWDRFSVYLPIGLMGFLALATYWLVQSTPGAPSPAKQRSPRHEPDYLLQTFSVKTFVRGGRLKSEVLGQAARHYPDSETLEIDLVRLRAFDEQGRLTTATANRALSNADGSEVQLFGKAQVVREAHLDKVGQTSPRIEFRGEYLHAYLDSERVESNLSVELRRGNDVFSADSMKYDNLQRVLTMQGRVRGTLAPTAAN